MEKRKEAALRDYSARLDRWDRALSEIYHLYGVQNGVSDAELWILYGLADGGAHTQADFCDGWCYSRQTVNTAVKGLAAKGMVVLIPRENNRKSKQIRLTQEGEALVRRVIHPLMQAELSVYDTLGEEDRTRLLTLLQQRCELLRCFLSAEKTDLP